MQINESTSGGWPWTYVERWRPNDVISHARACAAQLVLGGRRELTKRSTIVDWVAMVSVKVSFHCDGAGESAEIRRFTMGGGTPFADLVSKIKAVYPSIQEDDQVSLTWQGKRRTHVDARTHTHTHKHIHT